MSESTTASTPADAMSDVVPTETRAANGTIADEKSDYVMRMERQLREKSELLAKYEAQEELKLKGKREDLLKSAERMTPYYNAVKNSLPDHEHPEFDEHAHRAKTFLSEAVPSMNEIDMKPHESIVWLSCKASGTVIAMESLRKENQDKDVELKRSLESNEEKDGRIAKKQKDIDYLTELAESRQVALEKQVKEYQDLVARVQKHDYSLAPSGAAREYNKGLEAMRKHKDMASEHSTSTITLPSQQAQQTPSAESKLVQNTSSGNESLTTNMPANGKAPMTTQMTGMSASERASVLNGVQGANNVQGLATTSLYASAGSSGSTSTHTTSTPSNDIRSHMLDLRSLILCNGQASIMAHPVPSQRNNGANGDIQMSETERVMAALR